MAAAPMDTSAGAEARQYSNGTEWNYVVTAQRPTAVSCSRVGNFTAANEMNLILAKSTRLEIHHLTPGGLVAFLDVGIYGRIATMDLFRPANSDQDWLFISTERYKVAILSYDSEKGVIVTRYAGDVQDRIGRPANIGHLGSIDPQKRCIGLHLYEGMFKVIPLNEDGHAATQKAFNIRLEELQVIDIHFLYNTPRPTIAVLYQDTRSARHVKSYYINMTAKEFEPGPLNVANVEAGASMLIPVPPPMGGVIIVGEQTITYVSGSPAADFNPTVAASASANPSSVVTNEGAQVSIPIAPTIMKAFGRIDPDGSRYLLGDHKGKLYVLLLKSNGPRGNAPELAMEAVGETTIASTLTYLDNGVVFVGSTFGDSLLIRLGTDADENGSYITVMERYTNLGPITDFSVVDLERQGQGQVVTCSGAFRDGSLRIIRNGIGINEQATVEMPGIKGTWNLRPTYASEVDQLLVLSFVGETRVLAISDEDDDMAETAIAGFDAASQTLHCANTAFDGWIQVTSTSVRLVDCASGNAVAEWTPPEGLAITVATSSPTQVLVATSGGNLVYLTVDASSLTQVSHVVLEHEIAAVDMTPLGGQDPTTASFAVVGMWTDITVRIIALPSLALVHKEALGGETIARSVLFAQLEGIQYLLVGLGDGTLINFQLEALTSDAGEATISLRGRKKLSLGTQPIVLRHFTSKDTRHVFAASDRPTVIYSSNGKLLFSNINLREVNHVAQFNTASFPDGLAIVTETALSIGTIDEIQKLHIRTVPLGEMPRRLAHIPGAGFAVATIRFETVAGSGDEMETHHLRLYDEQTFEELVSYPLRPYENTASLTTARFEGDPRTYFVLGTAFVNPGEEEPANGRILVFSVDQGGAAPFRGATGNGDAMDESGAGATLSLVATKDTKGAVYSLCEFNGKLLAGISSKLQLYKWNEVEGTHTRELEPEANHHGHILTLCVQTRGDFIVVGDLMKSVSLLVYKPMDGTIEQLARDYNPNWMTAVEILSDDLYIGTENAFNLFTVKRNSEVATEEERGRLDVVGEFHLGEFVNKFRHGSLVMRLPEADGAEPVPTLLFGTVSGSIGVVASLPQSDFEFLSGVQNALNGVVKGIGGFNHEHWRSFHNERRTSVARGFLDGDLIEAFLDLTRDHQEQVAAKCGSSIEELTKKIEELTRLH